MSSAVYAPLKDHAGPGALMDIEAKTLDSAAAMMQTSSVLDAAAGVRGNTIDFRGYQKANHVDQQEAELLAKFASPSTRTHLLENNGPMIASALIKLLKVSKVETLQYVLTVINDVISDEPERLELFRSAATPSWSPYLELISREIDDSFTKHMACHIASYFVKGPKGVVVPDAQLSTFFTWLINELQAKDPAVLPAALSGLQSFLFQAPHRVCFLAKRNSIKALRDLLQMEQTFQLQYQTIASLWALSFNEKGAAALSKDETVVVSEISKILINTHKEKVARVCIATLRNMVEIPGSDHQLRSASLMIGQGLLPHVESIVRQTRWKDDEAKTDSEFLLEKLHDTYEHMSSFDEYKAEVISGQLTWSPVHRSERFWRENSIRLNEDKHELLKRIIKILEEASDPEVIAVAVHDLGQYVRFYPRGKKYVEELKGKQHVMNLMVTSSDMNVRYEALIAVQKLMTHNWEYLGEKVAKPQ